MSDNSASSHYKLFCDESCHLEHDNSDVMVLGTICCPEERVEDINRQIKTLRYQHNYKTELKWTINVSFGDGYSSLKREFSTIPSPYIRKYQWGFGDYQYAEGRTQKHTYAESRTYTVAARQESSSPQKR